MKVAVVIPSYKVKKHILNVILRIGNEINIIYVVDDCCPEKSGQFVIDNNKDNRVKVLFHEKNLGVGGAVKTGYKQALVDGVDIIVKVDGDGQMDPALIKGLIQPLIQREADYSKGNRFFELEHLRSMPKIRLLGNAGLSFVNKLSSGYWNLMDPTNGFTAIHRNALFLLPLDKIDNRYFFESDMLFRLNTIRAVVNDYPMNSKYEDEESNLKINRILFEFPFKYLNRFLKRIFYNYFLRDFNFGSICLIFGVFFNLLGITYGSYFWIKNSLANVFTSSGTVMISGIGIILGNQFIINFFNIDINNIPKKIIYEYKKN